MFNKKRNARYALTLIVVLLASALFTGCTSNVAAESEIEADVQSNLAAETTENTQTSTAESTWSEETHSNDVDPNYDIVFDDSEILEFNITIDSEDWQTMQEDLSENLKSNNKGGGGGKVRGGDKSNTKEMPDASTTPDTSTATDTTTVASAPDADRQVDTDRPADADRPVDADRPAVAEGEAAADGAPGGNRPPAMDGATDATTVTDATTGPGANRPPVADGEAAVDGAPDATTVADATTGPGANRPPVANGEAAVDGAPADEAPDVVASSDPSSTDSEGGYEPIWVESTVSVDGETWEHVGIRFKGNSSLTSAVSSGNGKLSLKLDFDEFEDEYPETDNQRFYGFKQLNLNNNFSDASLMHEKVAADLFREFGLVASETTFCIVNVDYGEGSQFFGVYALVEEIDDSAIEEQFGDDSGNLYKPDGSAASFAEGTFDESQMEKKNNEDEADYSDVEALYETINSDLRLTDSESWKDELESIFNVDGFLKYLAANNVIQNWDTYGTMPHNYYLYNDPDTGLLNWIPWDNNEAFSEGKGNRGALSLDLDEISDNWPLIRYIIDEEEYKAIYDDYLLEFVEEVYTEEAMVERYTEYYELIKEYAYAEETGYTYIKSDQEFDAAVDALIEHVSDRYDAVQAYLSN